MMTEHVNLDESLEPAILRGFSDEQKSRLSEQLDRYLCAMEQGELFDTEQLSRDHPDIAEVFDDYLGKLKALYGLAAQPSSRMPTSHMSSESPLRQLGDFQLIREVGRGGMGIVYVARQQSLDRTVALKLLPLASMLDERQIARFQNEAHAAGLLQHPHIVPVYSIGCEQGVHFYVMQFIDGITIDQWISHRRTESTPSGKSHDRSPGDTRDEWRIVVQWALHIANALQCAHENGIVHRDIKPSNLLLDDEQHVWIADFGLARCHSDLSLTGSGDMLGTMRYMSPEQAGGKSALVDGRSDIYSLAATLYEMLTLRPVYDGESAVALLRQIDEHRRLSLRQLCSQVPRDLETVLNKALSRGRDERYETAAEFAEDLGRVLSGEPTLARPPARIDRLLRWTVKHHRAAIITILISLLGTAGLAIGTTLLATEKRVSDANAVRSQRNAQLARSAVDDLGAQIAELLSDIPAAESIRRRLLLRTLSYYERFVASSGEDPALCEDLAITCGKIGSLYREIGSHADALAALRKSERLYAEFVRTNPSQLAAQLAWSVARNNLAEALHAAGELEEAILYFGVAIDQQQGLLAQMEISPVDDTNSPSAAGVATQLATTLNNLGLLLSQSNAVHRAESSYLQALKLLSSISIEEAPSPDSQQLVATLRTNLSSLLTQSNPQRAVELARQAVSDRAQQLEVEPSNAQLASQTITSLNALGVAQVANGQLAGSIDTFTQAIDMARQLLQRAPDHTLYRRDLVLSLNHLGMSYCRLGRLAEARHDFDQARSLQERLTTDFPNDAEMQSVLGGVLNNLGFLQLQLGDRSAAIASYLAAVEAQRAAVKLAPKVERYADYLAKHLANIQQLEEGKEAS